MFSRAFSTQTAASNSLLDIAAALAGSFSKHKIPYAIGGSLAQTRYSDSRLTDNIDINIGSLSETSNTHPSYHTLFKALDPFKCFNTNRDETIPISSWSSEYLLQQRHIKGYLPFFIYSPATERAPHNFTKVKLHHPSHRVQKLVMSVPGYIRPFPVNDTNVNFLSPEALIACKLILYRDQDKNDIIYILHDLLNNQQSLDQGLMDLLLQNLDHSTNSDRLSLSKEPVRARIKWFAHICNIYQDPFLAPFVKYRKALGITSYLSVFSH